MTLLQERRHEDEREVAVDDGRHAGEQLERRLERCGARRGGANSLR